MARFLTLNVGASNALLAEYAIGAKGAVTLTAYGTCELAAVDANSPESYAVELPSALHRIMQETGIRKGPVAVALSGQMVFPRPARFPAMGDADKLAQLVRYEIEQNVPFPIDEIVSDCQFLGDTPEGEKSAIIVAAKLDTVRAVMDGVVAAGLKPAVVDVSPMAVCNAMRHSCPAVDGCSVILDVGSKTTNLILIEGERIYTRTIPVAGNTITKEIAQAFGCTYAEAEQLKRERGYVSLGGVTEDEDEVSDRIAKIIRTVFTRLHAEISRSINFYRSQQGGSAPGKVYLTGGCARLPQLDHFFAETLQVEVEYLNPFANVAVGPKVNADALENDAFVLSDSVGLALRGANLAQIRINLMPPEMVERERSIKRIPFLVAGGVMALAALGVGVLTQNHARSVAEAKIAELESRNSSLRSLETKLKASQKSFEEVRERCDAFQQLMARRAVRLGQLKAVGDSLLPGMWIVEWKPLAQGRDGTGAPGARVTIRGWRDSMDKAEQEWSRRNGGKKSTAATIVEENLKTRPAFGSGTVKIVSQREIKECLTEFAIEMRYAPPVSVAPETAGKGKAKRK